MVPEQIKYTAKSYEEPDQYHYTLPLSLDINEIRMAFATLVSSQSMQIIDNRKSSIIAISLKSRVGLLNCLMKCFQKRLPSIVNVFKFECGIIEESSASIATIRVVQGNKQLLKEFCEQFELRLQSLLPKEDRGKIIKSNENSVVKDQFISDEPTSNEFSSYYYFHKLLSNESYGAGKVWLFIRA